MVENFPHFNSGSKIYQKYFLKTLKIPLEKACTNGRGQQSVKTGNGYSKTQTKEKLLPPVYRSHHTENGKRNYPCVLIKKNAI